MPLVYIVEDDESIREIESIALKNSGYDVLPFEDGKKLFEKLDEKIPDLLLLDVMLPDTDGYAIVKTIRNKIETRNLPIIMVTSKTTEMDMIRGLDYGADDFIKKPFSVMELVTRVKALLRRCQNSKVEKISIGNIIVDIERRKCEVNKKSVELTFKEFELLKYMIINKGIVLSREQLLLNVWNTDYEGETRTVDMHIKSLRQKLGEEESHIKTIRNVGYVIE